VACSGVVTWAFSRGDGGALDHAVGQRRTAIYGKAGRVPCAVLTARDGADGGPDSASSPRNQRWSLHALSAPTVRNAIPASGPGPRRSPAWCGTSVVLLLREGPGLG
jgi:hypothetical protein